MTQMSFAGKKKSMLGWMLVLSLLLVLVGTALAPVLTAGEEETESGVRLRIGAIDTTRTINQEVTAVLRWSAEIENEQGLENLVYANCLLQDPSMSEERAYTMEYVTAYPILVTSYEDNGAVKQAYYYWTSDQVTVAEDGRSFTIRLPESSSYDAYSVDYYTTYQPDDGLNITYFTQGSILQEQEDGSVLALVEAEGDFTDGIRVPEIVASISGEGDGISYQATVTIPAGNLGMIFNTGGMTVEKEDDYRIIPLEIENILEASAAITLLDGTVIALAPYQEGENPENTYQFAVNEEHGNLYAFNMVFNTETFDIWDSWWNVDEEAELTVQLTISMDTVDEDGKSIGEYLADGYTVTNYFFGRFQDYGLSEGTASYSSVVQKSSDLNDFVTNINIYDTANILQYGTETDGSTVNQALYVNLSYIYELTFEERNNPGDYYEMKPDESGYMTYQIPMQVYPLDDDLIPQEITLSNGKAVAEFFVENQTIKLLFYDVDEYGNPTSGTSWIDSPGLKKLTLRFEGAFKGGPPIRLI